MGLDMYSYTVSLDTVKKACLENTLIDINIDTLLNVYINQVPMNVTEPCGTYEQTQEEWQRYLSVKSAVIDKRAELAGYNSDFWYWRKFNALHGWMEALYRERGGQQSFNCIVIRLLEEDFDRMESDIKNNALSPTEGFFFGSQEIYQEDIADAIQWIASSREAIKDGYAVLYSSWW